MTPTKVLVGQIMMVFAIVILGTWIATEWVAFQLGFQMRLGAPWFVIHGQLLHVLFLQDAVPVYCPWRLFEWWYVYEAYAPRIFTTGGAIAATSGLLGAGAAMFGSVWRARQSKLVTTYGSARWASTRDIADSRLTGSASVFLGTVSGGYLRHDGPEHVMAFAPTRSGKGVGLVIPTLLSWSHSAVIHDIKGENWQLTAGWRSRFSHCLLFNPTDTRSAAYNPLLEVRRGMHEVRDVQNIADILVDPEGALERRNHWEKTSHALLVGAILHVLYAEKDKTLHGVANFLSDPARSFDRTLWLMMNTLHVSDKPHPVVASAAREVLNKSENERSGVLSTAMSFLGLYRDPTVAAVTSRCDWRIEDLVSAQHPVSLYLVVPPSDISRTKPLIRLILNQIGRRLTESLEVRNSDAKYTQVRLPIIRLILNYVGRLFRKLHEVNDGKGNRRQVLLMLDEFPALGRLDFFESALAFMAGYGLRSFLIAQSLNQIEKAYGANNSILDNCHVRIAFATNDERTAKRISDALGTATELRAQRNYAGHRLSPWLGHLMVSRQESARPLLTPGEVMQLPSDEEVLMVAGCPPIRAKKLRYYEDSNFTRRICAPPTLTEDDYPDRPAARADDWSTLSPRVKSLTYSTVHYGVDGGAEEGGLHRHPDAEHGVAETSTLPGELSWLVDESVHGQETDMAPAIDRSLRRTARLAVLDPDDGIPL